MTAAQTSTVILKTKHSDFRIPALEDREQHVWVDAMRLAGGLGAGTRVSNGIYVIQFASATVKINPATNIYSIKQNDDPRWRHVQLRTRDRTIVQNKRLYLTLESVPLIFDQSFTYHLQRKALIVGDATKPAPEKGFFATDIRTVERDQKVWISLEDFAKSLGIILYSFRLGSYTLTFPDFTMLDLTVGSTAVERRRQIFKHLYDPILSFSGSPYVSLASVNSLFEIEVKWDSAHKKVLVPDQYGRYRESQIVEIPKLYVIGYRPEPFKVSIDEVSVYYQEPDPTYLASNDKLIDSIRDEFTDDAIEHKREDWDQLNGSFVGGLAGSVAKAPFEARGSFQKLGSTTELVDGSARWGFPIFKLEGAREYLTFSGLSNQFSLIDYGAVSHSSDHYNDGTVNPNWTLKALYGRHTFHLHAENFLVAQSLRVEQALGMASLGAFWKISPRQNFFLRLEAYHFDNTPKERETIIIDPDYYNFLIGDDASIIIDPGDLTDYMIDSMLTDKHNTSILDMNYSLNNILDLTGTMGVSVFEDPLLEKHMFDKDWRVRAVLGQRGRRLDTSYEEVGENYRSAGNPFSYQNKKTFRLAPYVSIFKWWQMFGEYRRQKTGYLEIHEIAASSNEYMSLVNILTVNNFVIRASGFEIDYPLYKQRSGNLDLTQFFGRNSIDIGGGGAFHYTGDDILYKRSITGKAGVTFAKKNKKISIGEEITRHEHPQSGNSERYESRTNLLLEWRELRSMLQYNYQPRTTFSTDYLYTGQIRIGYKLFDQKILSLFYSTASRKSSLASPEVWRAGLEFSSNVF